MTTHPSPLVRLRRTTAALVLAVAGYWLTTLGTQSYRWVPDWIWYSVQQRPTLVVIGALSVLVGVYFRARRPRR